MAPPFPVADIMHTTGIDMELTSDVGVGFALLPVESAHLNDVGVGKSSAVIFFTLTSDESLVVDDSFSGRHVPAVVGLGAPVEVIRTNATPVVAGVKGAKVLGELASGQHQGYSGCNDGSALPLDNRSTGGPNGSHPQPAPRSIRHDEDSIHEFFFDSHALSLRNETN